jgi:hypothetical protein
LGAIVAILNPLCLTAWAAEPELEAGTSGESAPIAIEEESGVQSHIPVLISFGLHFGYDDNFQTTANPVGAWFSDQQLTLQYDRTLGPTKISLLSSVGAIERFDQDSEGNGLLDFSVTHEATDRLTLSASIFATYQSEPNFASNVGPTQVAGNYFSTSNLFSAAYQWSPRFSTVSSFSLAVIRYENSFTAAFTDREEYTFSEELRFALLRNTILVGSYRFLAVDYVTAAQDSTTHFALAGVEQSFNPRLHAQVRAGASFRSFQQGGDSVDPVFEGSVSYALPRNGSIDWTAGYSVEQSTTSGSSGQTAFRTGLQFRYGFTSRISSALGFNYQHTENQTGTSATLFGPTSPPDAYDFLVDLRYQVNRRVDIDLGYQHSETSSGEPTQNYSRNRYTIGLNFTF